MRVAFVALMIVLVLPFAAAQVPPALSACGPISIPANPAAPAPVAAGGRRDVVVQVDNGGQLAATVNVSARTSASGWLVAVTPADASVAGGGSGQFTFTIEATEDAEGDALVSFSASGVCQTPLGAQCPGATCNAGSANAQVTVPLQPPQGFRIPGLENVSFPLPYLLAAIVLIGLATAIPFAMRRGRSAGIVAECPEPLKMVKPGRGTSFPIELRNGAREAATAHFEVGPVPEGWSAFMPLPEVQLAAREARSLWLMVRSPPNASNGEAIDVELRLKDPRGRNGAAVKVRAEVQGAGEP